jgi:hypothetical protein
VKPTDPSEEPRHDGVRADTRSKKPYVKPAFLHEQVFETMALACGKVAGTTQQCNSNRKNS